MPERPISEQLDEAIDNLLGGTLQRGSPDSTLSALMKIVDRLQDMPDDGFKMRLSRELQQEFHRRTSMTVSTRIEPTAGEFAAIFVEVFLVFDGHPDTLAADHAARPGRPGFRVGDEGHQVGRRHPNVHVLIGPSTTEWPP